MTNKTHFFIITNVQSNKLIKANNKLKKGYYPITQWVLSYRKFHSLYANQRLWVVLYYLVLFVGLHE